MSNINRTSEKEKYDITSDWLMVFAYELEKNANLHNLIPLIHRKKFSSIEEKLADIKARIGFDLVSKFDQELNKTSTEKTASCSMSKDSCSCGCSVKTASTHSENDIKRMENILKYIKDVVQHEPHLDVAEILNRCRSIDELGFSYLKIDIFKLSKYIEDLLKKNAPNKSNNVEYIPQDTQDLDTRIDYEADYYSHSKPSV
jgi:hypothetical protein